jgi:hypothetical protein
MKLKRTYQKPGRTVTVTAFNRHILAGGSNGAKGVTTGAKLGNEYSSTDVSYSRQAGEWDEE